MSSKLTADNILERYGHARALMPFLIRKPLGHFFYITSKCNLNCDYCWQRELPGKDSENSRADRKELSGKEWINIIKSVPKLSFIGITGGEPLLHPDFKEIIKQLSGRVSYTLNTNGILLSDDIIESLIKSKASNISISLDGFSNVHDVSRKRSGLFDLIVERIERLNFHKKKNGSRKPTLTVKTVLLDPLVDQIGEFYQFCDKVLGADCLNISLMKTTEHAQYDFRVYENMSDIKNIGAPECYAYEKSNKIPGALEYLLGLSKRGKCKVLLYPKMGGKTAADLLLKSKGKEVFDSCHIPWALVVILSDGSVIPCLSLRVANIRDLNYDVKQISKSLRYYNFLKWRDGMNKGGKSPAECNMCCFSRVKVV